MSEKAGTVLTCSHAECGCRVQIQTPCSCPSHGDSAQYQCHCGAPLVAAD